MAFQEEDGRARAEGRWLFDGIKVPKSHGLVAGMVVPEGFEVVKIKVSEANWDWVRAFCEGRGENSVRLDANGRGWPGMFDGWGDAARRAVDFLEDPFLPEAGRWGDLPVVTADDFLVGGGVVKIVKPAREDWNEGEKRRQVVTSYLDHAVGQAFAAWEAGRRGVTEVAGLQTHGVFEEDPFFEELGEVRPTFTKPQGTGIGFDDLLEKLPWKKL